MGLLAGMAANRMQTRQSYRTISRMQRRRTWAQDRMGMRQDFAPAGEEPPPEAAAPPSEPDRCEVCGSERLSWRSCKLICANCRSIVKSCADL